LVERGERATNDVLTVPVVTRATNKVSEVADDLVSGAGSVLDEAHDTVEGTYAQFPLARDRVKRAVLPRWLHRVSAGRSPRIGLRVRIGRRRNRRSRCPENSHRCREEDRLPPGG